MAEWQEGEIQAFWLAIQLFVLLAVVLTLVLVSRKYIQAKLRDAKRISDLKIAHQKELLEDSIQVQEKERVRFANDLHDDLLSKLTVLGVRLHHEGANSESNNLLQECMQTARRISHDLSPPLLEESECIELLDVVFQRMETTHELEKHYSIQEHVDVSSMVKLQLIRIVQEVCNNIIKHAEADKLIVQLRMTSKRLSLLIKDNGKGFDSSQIANGLGRSNIEMRVQTLKGKYKLKSALGSGTLYLFSIPISS